MRIKRNENDDFITNKIKLKNFEWIFPNKCYRDNLDIKIFETCEKMINKKLSVETIFYNFHKIEILSSAIFDQDQLEKLKANNKINLQIIKNNNNVKINPFLNGISTFQIQNIIGNNPDKIILEDLF